MKNPSYFLFSSIMVIGLLMLLTNSCDTTTPIDKLPVLTTSPISDITQNTAKSGGTIVSDGGSDVSVRGVCWSLMPNPTIKDSKTIDAAGTGIFTSSLTGLIENTTYYLRAYASNSAGTSYGLQIIFNTLHKISPTLSTSVVSSITATTAICGGNITSDNGATVTSRGVCWSTSPNPTIADSKTTDGVGIGSFTSSITGLTGGTTYYVRAYATNSSSTGYGGAYQFTTTTTSSLITFNPNLTYGSVTDIDGNVYKTIAIGTQTWMAENLRTTKYNDGTAIPLVTSNTTWPDLTTPAYCWYNNATSYKSLYGALYNWYAVNTGKLAPVGWHVPTDAEWTTLTTFLGGENAAGGKLKETGTSNWSSPNTGATNSSGFTALPGGHRHDYNGVFTNISSHGLWWSSTEYGTLNAWARYMDYNDSNMYIRNYYKRNGLSVRCVKD